MREAQGFANAQVRHLVGDGDGDAHAVEHARGGGHQHGRLPERYQPPVLHRACVFRSMLWSHGSPCVHACHLMLMLQSVTACGHLALSACPQAERQRSKIVHTRATSRHPGIWSVHRPPAPQGVERGAQGPSHMAPKTKYGSKAHVTRRKHHRHGLTPVPSRRPCEQ